MVVKISDDESLVKRVRAELKERNNLCPLKEENIPSNHCMCQQFIEQSSGACECGLYIKVEP